MFRDMRIVVMLAHSAFPRWPISKTFIGKVIAFSDELGKLWAAKCRNQLRSFQISLQERITYQIRIRRKIQLTVV